MIVVEPSLLRSRDARSIMASRWLRNRSIDRTINRQFDVLSLSLSLSAACFDVASAQIRRKINSIVINEWILEYTKYIIDVVNMKRMCKDEDEEDKLYFITSLSLSLSPSHIIHTRWSMMAQLVRQVAEMCKGWPNSHQHRTGAQDSIRYIFRHYPNAQNWGSKNSQFQLRPNGSRWSNTLNW